MSSRWFSCPRCEHDCSIDGSQMCRGCGMDLGPHKAKLMKPLGATPTTKLSKTANVPGGRANGVPDSAFDSRALKKGTRVEYEHSPRKDIAKDIAKDHLVERRDYYEKLERMEKSPVEKKSAIDGFFDELQKIAEISQVDTAKREHAIKSQRQLLSTLQPGDIVFSAPHRNRRRKGDFVGKRIFKPLSRLVQGTDFGHTAVYTGKGKIVDTRMERATKEVPIKSLLSSNNIVAVRPKDVSPEEREKAVEYARSQIGKRYSFAALIRAGTPFQGKYHGQKPEEAKKLMCSGLAANAYAGRKFAPVSRKFIRPSQILRSRQVTPIAYMETAPQPV